MCPSPNPRKEDINKRKIKQRGMQHFFSSYLFEGSYRRKNKLQNSEFVEILYLLYYTGTHLYHTSLSSNKMKKKT